MPESVRDQLLNLLNSYRDCFAFNVSELGKKKTAEIREIIDELKENNIIRDSNSPFSSPILLVRKKNGETRMSIDYRALNAITKKDRYPLPLIEDQLNSLQGSTCFTSLDLACYLALQA